MILHQGADLNQIFNITRLSYYLVQCIQIILKHFTVKKNISNARVNKFEKNQLPSDFRSIVAANLCGESHHSNFAAEVFVDDDTSKTDYGCWSGNFLRAGTSRSPKMWSPSLPDPAPLRWTLCFLQKISVRSTSDADINRKKHFLQKKWP